MSRIDDGHPTIISFSGEGSGFAGGGASVLWEKEVTPPGISAGGPNDTTTMRNSAWRTKAPKQLLTLTDGSINVAYDPNIYTELVSMVGVNQQITVTYPDSTTLTFWGWIDEFTANPIREGEQPTADMTLVCGNQNAAGAETAPVVA
jgi:hypothetical protein